MMQRRELRYGPKRSAPLEAGEEYVGTFRGEIAEAIRDTEEYDGEHSPEPVVRFTFVAEGPGYRLEVEHTVHDHPGDLALIARSVGVADPGTYEWSGDVGEFEGQAVEFDAVAFQGQVCAVPVSIKKPSLSWQEIDSVGVAE